MSRTIKSGPASTEQKKKSQKGRPTPRNKRTKKMPARYDRAIRTFRKKIEKIVSGAFVYTQEEREKRLKTLRQALAFMESAKVNRHRIIFGY